VTGKLGPSLLRKLERVPLDSLQLYPGNPRRADDAAIRASLEENDQFEPVVVQKDTRYVLAGNHRVLAAQELGWESIDVVVVDVDDEHARRIMLASNKIPLLGGVDEEALAAQLAKLRSYRGTGFSEAERKALRARLAALRPSPAEDDLPEPPTEPSSKPGEVYELGPHRLMCGDSTDREQVEALMGGEKADCVFMDPPYAIYGSSSGLSSDVTDDKIVRPFFRDALAMAQLASRLFAPVFVCCDWRSWPSWWEVAKLTRLEPKNLVVWDKGGAGLGNNFANTYELVGYFLHAPEQQVMTRGRKAGIRPILKPNIVRANRVPAVEREHNAAKPLDLIREIVGAATVEGERVLDLFGGSGSTLVACDALGLASLTMEIDPAYCDVIRARYERLVDAAALAP
jgi:DNA modification methylase